MKNLLVKKIIQNYQPKVVFVAGTWGKTMTIQTATNVLSRMDVSLYFGDQKSLVNTILSVSGFSFPQGFLSMLFKKSYKDVLFVELSEETKLPKDLLGELNEMILIIPFISQYELQEFGSLQKYLQKRCLLTKARAKKMTVIFNKDVPGLEEAMADYGCKRLLSFSAQTDQADFKSLNHEYKLADDAHLTNDHRVQGMAFKVKNGGATLPLRLTSGVGPQQIYPILATLLLARILDVNIVDSLASIRDTQVLPGRMKLVPGIKKTLLLDDSYDIDAETAYTTFQVGSELPLEEGKQRIAVIGEMHKHGKDSEQAHCLLGDELASFKYDAIVGIGERAHDILRCARDAGMDEGQLFHFMDQVDAGKFIQHELKQGDLVVIKGSKEMKLESVVKELMAFPLKAKEEILQR